MNAVEIPENLLFEGIDYPEQMKLLWCLNAQVRHYGKGECLLREQETLNQLGIILKGSAEASKLEVSGKRLIISRLKQGHIFGDVLSINIERKSPATVMALESVSALLIPISGLLNPCQKQCECHDKLIRNLLKSVSEKYFEMQDRLFCITRSTMREKIMYFLEGASESADSNCRDSIFSIPFDRAALAEYLNAERSALSRELSAMKREGIIDYHKNNFRIISIISTSGC